MKAKSVTPAVIAETMLAMVDPAGFDIAGQADGFTVTIAGAKIVIGEGRGHAFERLAAAIEARIAFDRACAMVLAAGEEGVPLWLVSGSSVLGRWLAWSRTERALVKTLTITGTPGIAPVIGQLSRRARRELGQLSAKIRVNAGQAVAERIELSHKVPATAVFADKATVRVRRLHLPETIVTSLQKHITRNDRWRAAEIVDHPFFNANDLMVAEVRNDGDDVLVELETAWQPLQPIPKAAWAAVPRGADPAFPWRATTREVAALYKLAARGDRMIQGDR